jgi:hypothetical protein
MHALVAQASGTFIHAVTAHKFVRESLKVAKQRLDDILQADNGGTVHLITS